MQKCTIFIIIDSPAIFNFFVFHVSFSECNCNEFSHRCFFDKELYDRTGHGGHCLDCAGNRDGANCERCRENYYQRKGDTHCSPCECNEVGEYNIIIIIIIIIIATTDERFSALSAGDRRLKSRNLPSIRSRRVLELAVQLGRQVSVPVGRRRRQVRSVRRQPFRLRADRMQAVRVHRFRKSGQRAEVRTRKRELHLQGERRGHPVQQVSIYTYNTFLSRHVFLSRRGRKKNKKHKKYAFVAAVMIYDNVILKRNKR